MFCMQEWYLAFALGSTGTFKIMKGASLPHFLEDIAFEKKAALNILFDRLDSLFVARQIK